MGEAGEPPHLLGGHVLAGVEIANFACDDARELGCVKAFNVFDSAPAFDESIPILIDRVAERGQCSHAGDNHPLVRGSILRCHSCYSFPVLSFVGLPSLIGGFVRLDAEYMLPRLSHDE